jgi:hypothetical protein
MCLSDPASANPSDWYYPSVFALKFRQRGTSPCTPPRGPLDVDRRVLALKSRARTPEVSSGEHPNPQRRTTLEKMSVQCLYLPMDPDFRIGFSLEAPPRKKWISVLSTVISRSAHELECGQLCKPRQRVLGIRREDYFVFKGDSTAHRDEYVTRRAMIVMVKNRMTS